MGKNHARVLADMDEIELVAICDSSEKNAKILAERYHIPFYTNHNIMLKEHKLDMASIAVPTNLHFDIAKDVIEEGISVLIEKPIASKIEEAKTLINLAKDKGVVLTVGHTERFNPAVVELKKRIDKGELGTIYKISSSRLSPFPARVVDMGVIIDLAVHDLDVFYYLLDSDVLSVQATMDRRLHKQHEDICVAFLRFKNGVVGILNVDRLTPVPVRELRVTGSKGMFEVNYLLQELYFYKNSAAEDESYEYTNHAMGVIPGDMIKVQIKKREPLRAELEEFAIAVKNKSKPAITGNEALRALKLAYQIIEAAKSSK